MKRWIGFIVVMAMVCCGYTVEAAGKGRVKILPNAHVFKFQVDREGYLTGLTEKITPENVWKVRFNSDRMGWGDCTTPSSGSFDTKHLTTVIQGTANNDLGLWSVWTYDNRKVWFIPSQWALPRGAKIVSDDEGVLVEYSTIRKVGYQNERMVFDKASYTLTLEFNANVLGGLMITQVRTDYIDRVVWCSDLVGWMESSTMFGTMTQDSKTGNWKIVFNGMPATDAGNVGIQMLDGTWIWVNIDAWNFDGATINLNNARGVIEYQMVD